MNAFQTAVFRTVMLTAANFYGGILLLPFWDADARLKLEKQRLAALFLYQRGSF